jgi:hypothetical protein
MTSSFTKRKLISTSTNDKLGNYNASSIVYTLVSNQKMADGKFVASISKNYFIQLQTKVISFVETYSDSPTISAREMKKKYSELSRLILNTFKIEKE